jgi:hypothetical protein
VQELAFKPFSSEIINLGDENDAKMLRESEVVADRMESNVLFDPEINWGNNDSDLMELNNFPTTIELDSEEKSIDNRHLILAPNILDLAMENNSIEWSVNEDNMSEKIENYRVDYSKQIIDFSSQLFESNLFESNLFKFS